MINRLVAAVIVAVAALAAGPAAPAPAAVPDNCATVTLDGVRGVYRPDSTFWLPWFDVTVRGRSTPCRTGGAPGTLAVTQYHVRDGATIGLMSTPWRTAPRGSTSFSRAGRIEADIAALCVSTGVTERDGVVVARNAACVQPVRSGTDHLVTRFAPVPLTDPLVNAELAEYPKDGTEPTAPRCTAECLVTPFVSAPSQPRDTPDTPNGGPIVPLRPYEPICHHTSIDDSFAGPSDDPVNGYDLWMTGSVTSCDPEREPTIHAIRYWRDRGIAMRAWELAWVPLIKGAQVNENTGAVCLASGLRERGGRLYGVHDLCWRVVRDQSDRYRLVPLPTDDPRVRKPVFSNIVEPDPKYPPGPCATCL